MRHSNLRATRPRSLRRLLAAAALALVAAVGAAGCGADELVPTGDAGQGKQLFNGKGRCAGCHTLADAGAQGNIGPNLDDAFRGDRIQGFKESTIRQVVRSQIENAILPMPANLLRGAEADAVATYVASVAGVPVKGGGGATASPPAQGGGGGTAAGGAAKGKALYASLGCQGCHSLDGSKGTGPTFKGLAGSKVKLQGGQTVTADDTYLLDSIVDPDKQIVAGYQKGLMSTVIKPHSVSAADAKALVAFIKAQK